MAALAKLCVAVPVPFCSPDLTLSPAMPATHLLLDCPFTPRSQASLSGFLLLQAQLEGHASSSRQASLGFQRELTTASQASSHLEMTTAARVSVCMITWFLAFRLQSQAKEGVPLPRHYGLRA